MRATFTITILAVTGLLLLAAARQHPPRRKALPPELKTRDGAVMVLVPTGKYYIGTDNGPAEARPRHPVELPAFYIDKYEVTNERYLKFCIATGHRPPPHLESEELSGEMKNLPVVNVTYHDAESYARRLNKKLPTEAEWEVAARGGKKENIYPWGDLFKPGAAAIERNKPAPVGSHEKDVSAFGVYDMAANVTEWTRDRFKPYPGAPEDLEFPEDTRVVRGGNYASATASELELYFRRPVETTHKSPLTGFRCVKEIRYR